MYSSLLIPYSIQLINVDKQRSVKTKKNQVKKKGSNKKKDVLPPRLDNLLILTIVYVRAAYGASIYLSTRKHRMLISIKTPMENEKLLANG